MTNLFQRSLCDARCKLHEREESLKCGTVCDTAGELENMTMFLQISSQMWGDNDPVPTSCGSPNGYDCRGVDGGLIPIMRHCS